MADIARFRENLKKHGFESSYFATAAEAAAYLDSVIDGTTVGVGGSVTIRDMGLADKLRAHNELFWHWLNPDDSAPASTAEVYLCSVNAAAETGELVNIDGGGNRLSSGLYGHDRLYFVMGVNKLMPDADAALHRARNVAAPLNARRLKRNTPCAVHCDRCYNCDSPDRICGMQLVYWRKPYAVRHVEVVIVGEALGF